MFKRLIGCLERWVNGGRLWRDFAKRTWGEEGYVAGHGLQCFDIELDTLLPQTATMIKTLLTHTHMHAQTHKSRRNVDIVAANRDLSHCWHQTLPSNGFETRSDSH